ncbi:hypothetical protein [Dysgonomonas sp. 511]|uniref:hypothetical protein n=1 Tax=Dysgonomonas sp. 511 TaxID=2302930 RepID=UPI0013D3F022|nr:hypothetical protein [Dysgonomonas sp. 511]
MLAQVYHMQQRNFENIPHEILDNINEMGIDCDLYLTKLEGEYFNALYQVNKQEYNLCGKKIFFLTGSLGKTKSNKKMYFKGERSRFKSNNSPSIGTLHLFDIEQKEQSGGYDGAIVYWSKKFTSTKDIVKILKKHNSSNKNCSIKKISVLEMTKKNNYYMKVEFNNCTNKEDRIKLVKAEFYKYNSIEIDIPITVIESSDKLYQIYRYEINIERVKD